MHLQELGGVFLLQGWTGQRSPRSQGPPCLPTLSRPSGHLGQVPGPHPQGQGPVSSQAWLGVLNSGLAEASCQPDLSIPATSELRQEDYKLKAYLSYRHILSQVLPLTLQPHPKPSIWSTV